MAEQPGAANNVATGSTNEAPSFAPKAMPKAAQNPAFRMMGLPNFRLRLPSRNWLIFISITGSFTTALLYDKYHKRKAQQKWCRVVSHLAQESLPTNQMPRTVTICLAAPPGDGLRAAREHFHEYVKPILVAGALDWEVIEGRKEGDVRAGLAAKIRKLRRGGGEGDGTNDLEEDVGPRLAEFRRGAGIQEWAGMQGDLVLGRHTWKEYVRGLHEGWLGPVAEPAKPEPSQEASLQENGGVSQPHMEPGLISGEDQLQAAAPTGQAEAPKEGFSDPAIPEKAPEKPSAKSSPTPPYIRSEAYPTASLSVLTPSSLQPTTAVPLPHLLGFLNTPIRFYRFLTRRYLADETGELVATLVLASSIRSFDRGKEFYSSTNIDEEASMSPQSAVPAEVVESTAAWEQESVLANEEEEWHKSARAPNPEEDPDRERPWKEKLVIDERIGARMRTFELSTDEKSRRSEDAEAEMEKEKEGRQSRMERLLTWMGFQEKGMVKGWEHGLVGEEEM